MNKEIINYVLYHANCDDGFGAALAAWKSLPLKTTKFIPVSYSEPPPEIKGTYMNIYLLDFCYPEPVIDMWAYYHHITIIDHHISAEETINKMNRKWPNVYSYYDVTKSGARLAWEYFHGYYHTPKLIELIEDRDLWRYNFSPDTEIMHNALNTIPRDFRKWSIYLYDVNAQSLIERYRIFPGIIQKTVRDICKDASFDCSIHAYPAKLVLSSVYISEIGAELSNLFDIDIGIVLQLSTNGRIKVSLRTKKDDVDVSKIAEKFGGGGHKKAAGFYINFNQLEYEEASGRYYFKKT